MHLKISAVLILIQTLQNNNASIFSLINVTFSLYVLLIILIMPMFSEFRFKYNQHHNGLRDHDPQQQVPAGVLPDQLLRQRQECVLPGTVQYSTI